MSKSETLSHNDVNVTITDADTEYSHTFTKGTKWFSFQCRTSVDIRFAFATGKVAGSTAPYQTLKADGGWTSSEKIGVASGEVIYFAASSGSLVVELVEAVHVNS